MRNSLFQDLKQRKKDTLKEVAQLLKEEEQNSDTQKKLNWVEQAQVVIDHENQTESRYVSIFLSVLFLCVMGILFSLPTQEILIRIEVNTTSLEMDLHDSWEIEAPFSTPEVSSGRIVTGGFLKSTTYLVPQ